ncbi:RHS repeat domain-containing protein [Dinghuibacter silviterrae]|uniref:YD repeat-containing protein n=1 Tax=Dinghuibacter silviterrae TaxID=1539049 RepID=A0A4R8DIS1_9BACT|nr:hypothetical protein [Dinghuibacter silviterrae]TDW97475.1 YD repeat-containing protein [Dinghuibacter silviterrae]
MFRNSAFRALGLFSGIFCFSLASAQVETSNSQIEWSANLSASNSLMSMGVSRDSVSVDQFTGMATALIPLCTLSGIDLSVPVGLAYTSGNGVRVQDFASDVGLGWQLNAGGSITRTVRGLPDEQDYGYIGIVPNNTVNQPPMGQVINSWLGSNQALTTDEQRAIGGSGAPGSEATEDCEPDLFYVSTPYFSFQFVFDQNGNPVFSNNYGFKVIANNFYLTPNNYGTTSFEVIDDRGNQYYFGANQNDVQNVQTTLFSPTVYTFPTTWYLDKIVTFNSKETITLTYLHGSANDAQNHYMAGNSYYCNTTDNPPLVTGLIQGDATPQVTTLIPPVYVSTITSSQGQVTFNYAWDRKDDANAARLSSVVLTGYDPLSGAYDNTLRTYALNYTYFNQASGDPNQMRLQLENVLLEDNNPQDPPIPLATFGYYTTYNLPSRTAYYAADYFGFYNNGTVASTMTYPSSGKAPNMPYTEADILTDVNDVFGGNWHFTYESNMANNLGTAVSVDGIRVNQLSHNLATGESLTKSYSYLTSGNFSSGQLRVTPYNVTYVSQTTGGSSNAFYTFSETPYILYDPYGNFVTYSTVKVTDQDGGSTVTNFTNYPDQSDAQGLGTLYELDPMTSNAYKRGLLLSQYIYNAAGTLLESVQNTYASQLSQVGQAAWGWHQVNYWYYLLGSTGYVNYDNPLSGAYHTNVDNFALTTTVATKYDMVNSGNTLVTTTSYTYSPNDLSLVHQITTTNSKGNTFTRTIYHPGDAAIPMVANQAESNTITAMATPAVNNLAAVIHQTDSTNTVVTDVHNTYISALNQNIYLGTSTQYVNKAAGRQKNYFFDQSASDLLSSYMTNGMPVSSSYGYNGSFVVAKVNNGTSTTAQSTHTLTSDLYCSSTTPLSITMGYAGTVTLALVYTNLPGSGTYNTTVNFSYTGPTSGSGCLCTSSNSSCGSCGGSSLTLSLLKGTYQISVTSYTNTATGTTNPFIQATYPGPVTNTLTTGFFFEGFEQNHAATLGSAHTGNAYYNGNDTVTWQPPDSRTYLIQWWNLSGGTWNFNQTNYTPNKVLTGPVDDIRIFPSDAQMTTYTYTPMVGKTSETDPAGHSVNYTYDAFGRPQLVMDQDHNILKDYAYSYGSQSQLARIILTNNTSYTTTPDIINLTIDNNTYSFPASNSLGSVVEGYIPYGTHLFTFSCTSANNDNPSSIQYTMNGTAVPCTTSQTAFTVNGDINIIAH